jgi:response regulator RpfG family c-di-GMP phosphodiesterase
MSSNQHTILCLDDERNILQSLKRLLRKEGYNMLFASSGEEAFNLLKENDVHLIISDQRMPQMSGTEFLAKVKEKYPDVLRVILTGYTDVDSITESINKGHIYKFFLKPWNDHNLKLEIRQALDQYDLIKANRHLDETVVRQNKELQQINEKLEDIVDERTREIALKNHALELSHCILENLPIAVLGVDTDGVIVLSNEMANSVVNGERIKVSVPLNQYFESDVMEAVSMAIDSGQPVNHQCRSQQAMDFNAVITPLSGKFSGKGAVMTLVPCAV